MLCKYQCRINDYLTVNLNKRLLCVNNYYMSFNVNKQLLYQFKWIIIVWVNVNK